MKKINKVTLAFTTSLILVAVIIAVGFTSASTSQAELNAIKQDIPNNWWEGGWDKVAELKDFISRNRGNPNTCAQAQYYLGCNYKVQGDYNNALAEYGNLIATYPQITSECAKAQFEMAQIYFYSLNDMQKATAEYKKLTTNYPDSSIAPLAQIALGRALRKQKDYAGALAEYQKVIDNYPQARKQQVEAYMDMGDMAKEQKDLTQALSYYKKAYLACPFGDTNAMQWVIDVTCETLRARDGTMASANQFLKYQKYGPQGEDKLSGSPDDLTNPMDAF